MKQLLLSLSLLAVLAVGCDDSVTSNAKKDMSNQTTAASGEGSHDSLLPEVNKAALESTIAKNDITLVEFTATW